MALPTLPPPQGTRRRWPLGRNFTLLWLAQTISECGSRITREGLPLTATLVLAATPTSMLLLATAGTLPALLLGLLAGVWIDRLKRRPVMIAADLGRAALLATIPLAALLGALHMAQLYLVAGVTGILTLFFEAANQAFLPLILDDEQLIEGNSKLSASASLAEIGGPALTGLLVQVMTAPLAICFDALSFLFSACCLGMVRVHEPQPEKWEQSSGFWQESGIGLRLLLSEPLIRTTTVVLCVRSFLGGTYTTLYALYILRQLAIPPVLYGLLVTMGGVGALLGALLASRFSRRFGREKTLLGAMLVSTGALFLTPLALGPRVLVVAMLMTAQFVGDFAMEVYLIHALSLRQSLLPEHFLGRANASANVLLGTLLLLGALFASLCSQVIGMRLTFLVMACAGLVLQLIWVACSHDS